MGRPPGPQHVAGQEQVSGAIRSARRHARGTGTFGAKDHEFEASGLYLIRSEDLALRPSPQILLPAPPCPEGATGRGGLRSASPRAVMACRGVVVVVLLSALPLVCLELRRGAPSLGIKDLMLLCGRMFLLLALLTIIIFVTTSLLNLLKSSPVYLKEEDKEEKNEKRQRLVRKKQQEAQGEKASRYLENVLKPQQEMKLKKLEERFYHMTGETWKLTHGHKLGGDEDLVLEKGSQSSSETSSREAAERRNLQKLLTEVSLPAPQPVRKKVPDLPEEPPETAEEVVTVALRCPSGRILRRRFYKSWSSQVLLDWMMKIGYPSSLYSLSTSFPRRPLEVEGGWSLKDVGITVDMVLNVDEKEQSNC